jgi:hypothetical protein
VKSIDPEIFGMTAVKIRLYRPPSWQELLAYNRRNQFELQLTIRKPYI